MEARLPRNLGMELGSGDRIGCVDGRTVDWIGERR